MLSNYHRCGIALAGMKRVSSGKSNRLRFFANRIVAMWNSLPDHVVSSVSLNMFNYRLDTFLHALEFYDN